MITPSEVMDTTVRPPTGEAQPPADPTGASLHATSSAVPSNVSVGIASMGVVPLYCAVHRKFPPAVTVGRVNVCSRAPLVLYSSTNRGAYVVPYAVAPSPARTTTSEL